MNARLPPPEDFLGDPFILPCEAVCAFHHRMVAVKEPVQGLSNPWLRG